MMFKSEFFCGMSETNRCPNCPVLFNREKKELPSNGILELYCDQEVIARFEREIQSRRREMGTLKRHVKESQIRISQLENEKNVAVKELELSKRMNVPGK